MLEKGVEMRESLMREAVDSWLAGIAVRRVLKKAKTLEEIAEISNIYSMLDTCMEVWSTSDRFAIPRRELLDKINGRR